jgi:uncharacterized protein involved in type VI secretion and phage assembly
LGTNVLLPQRLYGHDRISHGFDYTVDLLSLNPEIELKQLIAQEVTLWLLQPDSSYSPLHGFVNTARRLGSDGQLSAYQIVFSSFLHFLKFRKDARIWQDKGADEIIAEVLGNHSQCQGKFRFELNQGARIRSYCTQYETDWQFVMRMMESEGWYGYLLQEADGSGHSWVITDSVQSLKPLAPCPTASLPRERSITKRRAAIEKAGCKSCPSMAAFHSSSKFMNTPVPTPVPILSMGTNSRASGCRNGSRAPSAFSAPPACASFPLDAGLRWTTILRIPRKRSRRASL